MKKLIRERQLYICGPVRAEILTGIRDEHFKEVEMALDALPWVDLDKRAWMQVARVSSRLHFSGSKTPLTDIEIAVAAVCCNAKLWTLDSDYGRIAGELSELQLA